MTRRFTQKDGFPRLIDYLPTPVKDLTVLNLGAGKSESNVSRLLWYLPFMCITHLDIYEPDLNELASRNHQAQIVSFLVHDLTQPLWLADDSYLVVLILDVLEHLKEDAALAMLREAERVASDRVIIFFPSGPCPSPSENEPNPYQAHLSVWYAQDLEILGYTVDIMEDFHDLPTGRFDACWAWKEV